MPKKSVMSFHVSVLVILYMFVVFLLCLRNPEQYNGSVLKWRQGIYLIRY